MTNCSETRDDATSPILKRVSSHPSAGAAVVSGIAEAKNVQRRSLDSVSEAISLDAIDSLFRESADLSRLDVQLSFSVDGCKVILYGDGRVFVAPEIEPQP